MENRHTEPGRQPPQMTGRDHKLTQLLQAQQPQTLCFFEGLALPIDTLAERCGLVRLLPPVGTSSTKDSLGGTAKTLMFVNCSPARTSVVQGGGTP